MEAEKEKEVKIVECAFALDAIVTIKSLGVEGFVYKLVVMPGYHIEYNVVFYQNSERKNDWFTQDELSSCDNKSLELRKLGL